MRRPQGRTTGMYFTQYISFLFDLNARSPLKLTDVQIGKKLREEFPHDPRIRKRITQKSIQRYRNSFNGGRLRLDVPIPAIPSFRYNDKGVILRPYANRARTPNDIQKAIIRQQQVWFAYQAEASVKIKIEGRKVPPPKKKKRWRGRWLRNKRAGEKRYYARIKALREQMAQLQSVPAAQDP